VQEYTCGSRIGVVLRFGTIVGDDPMTRMQLRAVRRGQAIGLGAPDGWAHLVHTDDLGSAVLAALHVPSGVYNVGAEPVRRVQMVAGYSIAAGRESIDFVSPLVRWLGGARLEPLARSLRVSSEHFSAQSGWVSRRAHFDASWFAEAMPRVAAR
jgi:nucleoside-diphosphate-sugar epimerase